MTLCEEWIGGQGDDSGDGEVGGPGEKDERSNQGYGSRKEGGKKGERRGKEGSGTYVDLGLTNILESEVGWVTEESKLTSRFCVWVSECAVWATTQD